MADTKVSGLALAAGFLTTHELPVNEAGTSKKTNGAQVIAVVAQGTAQFGSAAYAQVTASQGSITTQADLTGLAVTVTPGSGRRIRISGIVLLQSTVADDYAAVFIMEGATQLQQANVICRVANDAGSASISVILTPTNVAHTYKLQAARVIGSGTVTMTAGPTLPAYILVEDIGV